MIVSVVLRCALRGVPSVEDDGLGVARELMKRKLRAGDGVLVDPEAVVRADVGEPRGVGSTTFDLGEKRVGQSSRIALDSGRDAEGGDSAQDLYLTNRLGLVV